MSWVSVNTRKPELGQEVLVFCQGYDVTGTRYWSDYELAIYDIDYSDRRRFAFYQSVNYRVEKRYDGSTMRSVWKHRGVTHWMPLPLSPLKIDRDTYAKLAGYDYTGVKE